MNEGGTPRRPMDPEVHSERIAILEVHQQQFRTDLSTATMLLTRSAGEARQRGPQDHRTGSLGGRLHGEIKRNLESHEHRSNTERSVHTAAIQSIQGRLDRRSGQMDAVSDAEKKREGTIDGIFAKNAPKIILALLLTLVAVLTGHASAPDAGR